MTLGVGEGRGPPQWADLERHREGNTDLVTDKMTPEDLEIEGDKRDRDKVGCSWRQNSGGRHRHVEEIRSLPLQQFPDVPAPCWHCSWCQGHCSERKSKRPALGMLHSSEQTKRNRMSADDKCNREIKPGKGRGELTVRAGCYFSKVVREDLPEKVTFEKMLERNEGANHWICGGKVFQGTTSAKALGQEREAEANTYIQRQTCRNMMTQR